MSAYGTKRTKDNKHWMHSLSRCFSVREKPSFTARATSSSLDIGPPSLSLCMKRSASVTSADERELGYGEFSTLSTEDRIRVEDEATQCVEQWEETDEMRTNFTIRLATPLRHLLAEYHDICERILDEYEIDAGLWAYRKRAQKSRRPVSL